MRPPSSSVPVFQAKVSIHQQKFIPVIIRRVHHVPFTLLRVSRLRTGSPFIPRSLDRHVGLKVATHMSDDVCPDKCWFAVFCPFCLQCSHGLRRKNAACKEKWQQISKWRQQQ